MVTLADKIRAMQLYYPEFGMSIGELGVWTFRWGKSGCLLMEGRGDTFVSRSSDLGEALDELRQFRKSVVGRETAIMAGG
jgi:hypothetical protein